MPAAQRGQVIDVQATPVDPKKIAGPSKLGAVKRGIIRRPKRFMFYGADGTGKTTLAADAPAPIFLDIEGGSFDVDVARYPFDPETERYQPVDYPEVLSAIDDITNSAHSYQTLVFDTTDSLEALLWQWMIKRDNDPSVMKREAPLSQIEDYGYGKGYSRAVDVWREFCVRLDRLRAIRKMEVVLLAHAQIKNFKNPDGADYDRWIPAMNVQASGFLKGWCDIVGRICHEETTTEKVTNSKYEKVKGLATGARVIRLAHTASADAKGRGNLPEEILIPRENPWGPLAEAIEASYVVDVAKLTREIDVETKRIGDPELTAKVTAAVKAAIEKQDVPTLHSYLNNLRTRPAKAAAAAQ